MIKTKKYYPADTTLGQRFNGQARITLRQALDIIEDIIKIVPTASQQEVYVVGWDKIGIYADQKLSPAELIEEKEELLAKLAQRMQQPNFAKEEITEVLNKLQEIR